MNGEFFLGWGSLSLIVAGIAQAKNRSGFYWWIAAMFLGPVALFCLVFFADKLPDEKQ